MSSANVQNYNTDWLLCTVSRQFRQAAYGVEATVHVTEPDFSQPGLKQTTLIRAIRLTIDAEHMLQGLLASLQLNVEKTLSTGSLKKTKGKAEA